MKRFFILIILAISAVTLVSAQAKKGPIVDKVYFDVRMQEDIALKDTAEGKADVFMYGVQGNTFKAVPQDTQNKLEVYNIPSGSWSIMINPIPNAAPYTWTVEGKTYFNPLAIKEVRFALNFLLDRKYIVDEILGGNGGPMFTMATPGQPGTYKYNLIGAKFGFTATGNEKKAIQDITNAIAKASELKENKGKLVKGDKFWKYNGEDVTVKFMIRVDDPNGRLKEGRYIADQIEKAGIKVERLEWDRKKATSLCYNGNPATYEWHLYTEGWGAGATRQYWDNIVSQMYAPWGGYQAGGQNPDFWNYENKEIDALTQKVQNGQFQGEKDYWDSILKATEMGLSEATRIYVAYQSQLYTASKARFNQRMAYGLGDGMNAWSIITADVKPEKSGEKILKVTQFSAKGSLFMSAWDPVGPDGFNDMYSLNASTPVVDLASFESPNAAVNTPWRASWKDVQTDVKAGKNEKGEPTLEGQLPVPEKAVLYNSKNKKWEPVGAGVKSFSKATYTYKWGNWHSGVPMGIADILYAQAFIWEWINKDGDNDKYYDAAYESSLKPNQDTLKGIVINPDKTITVYYNFNHMDKERVGSAGAIYTSVTAASQTVNVSWEILEAMAKMVAEGGKSGTSWSFSSDPAYTEVDVLNPKCLADIKYELQRFIKTGYVPESIKDYTTSDEAAARYKAAIKFIDEHKNAYINNGAFILNNVDLNANFVELAANRDPSYPFESGYWNKFFKTTTTRIDSVTPPAMATKGKAIAITLKVSTVEYPANTATPADKTVNVKLTFVTPTGEKVYKATFDKAGQFSISIPAADTKDLKAGSYTIVAESQLKSEAPSVEPTTLVLF